MGAEGTGRDQLYGGFMCALMTLPVALPAMLLPARLGAPGALNPGRLWVLETLLHAVLLWGVLGPQLRWPPALLLLLRLLDMLL